MITNKRGYCAHCWAACPTIAEIKDGIFTKVTPDKDHPNAVSELCPKGIAGPELVYSDYRIKYPMKRTNPKTASDPGWERITWDEAYEIVASRLNKVKEQFGAERVAFHRSSPSGTPASDFNNWNYRLAFAFGTPNTLATTHICQWSRDAGSAYTYGRGLSQAEFEKSACMLIWGQNTKNTALAIDREIEKGIQNGARLIVVDPRYTELAERADIWLQVFPGTDQALILSFLNVLITNQLYDRDFTRHWTNAPFLVRTDTMDMLKANEVYEGVKDNCYLIWDENSREVKIYNPQVGKYDDDVKLLIEGSDEIMLLDGKKVKCKTSFLILKELVEKYTPKWAENITGVPGAKIDEATRLFATTKPGGYFTYNGIEQQVAAIQTNRALCIFYALTGNYDTTGGNRIFPKAHTNLESGFEFLDPEVESKRIGYKERPLGPAGPEQRYRATISAIRANDLYESILNGNPYEIKALVAFGGNLSTSNPDSMIGKKALEKLDFYVHVDLFENPSTRFADILLPAATYWESPAIKPSFKYNMKASRHIQYREPVIPPMYESKPDIQIIFELAKKLGLGDKFCDGDIEAGFNYQIEPTGLTVEELRKNPGGITINTTIGERNYAQKNSTTGKPKGFKTPSGKVEIFSQLFKDYGHDPLPVYHEEIFPKTSAEYPLTLTFFKTAVYSHGMGRCIPSLRKAVPEPYIEINPKKAAELNINDGEWVSLETKKGRMKAKAKFVETMLLDVIATQHGWWQDCNELGLPGYEPFSSDGSNANMLTSDEYTDPIDGSYQLKGIPSRLNKIENNIE